MPGPSKRYLSDAEADALVSAARDAAGRLAIAITIVVVDPAGLLLRLVRDTDALLVSLESALSKAQTSNKLRASTAMVGKMMESSMSLLAIKEVNPYAGGLPITLDGTHVGAIAISGGSVEQDEEIAQAALAALA